MKKTRKSKVIVGTGCLFFCFFIISCTDSKEEKYNIISHSANTGDKGEIQSITVFYGNGKSEIIHLDDTVKDNAEMENIKGSELFRNYVPYSEVSRRFGNIQGLSDTLKTIKEDSRVRYIRDAFPEYLGHRPVMYCEYIVFFILNQ